MEGGHLEKRRILYSFLLFVLVFSVFLPSLDTYATNNGSEPIRTIEPHLPPQIDPNYPVIQQHVPNQQQQPFQQQQPNQQQVVPGASSNSFELRFADNVPEKYRSKLTEEFNRVYPLLVQKWNPNAPRTVYLSNRSLNEGSNGLPNGGQSGRRELVYGQAEGNQITLDFSINQDLLEQGNYWVFLHELAHIPSMHLWGATWFAESVADYSVLLFGDQKTQQSWSQLRKPEQPQPNVEFLKQNYYMKGAQFLAWLDTKYKSTLVEELNRAGLLIFEEVSREIATENRGLSRQQFNETFRQRYEPKFEQKIQELTGKTLAELWSEFVQDPNNYKTDKNCLVAGRCQRANGVQSQPSTPQNVGHPQGIQQQGTPVTNRNTVRKHQIKKEYPEETFQDEKSGETIDSLIQAIYSLLAS